MCAAKIFTLPLSHCTQRHPSAIRRRRLLALMLFSPSACVCLSYICLNLEIYIWVCVRNYMYTLGVSRGRWILSRPPLLFAIYIPESDLIRFCVCFGQCRPVLWGIKWPTLTQILPKRSSGARCSLWWLRRPQLPAESASVNYQLG